MRTLKQTRTTKLFFCDVCGRRIANRKLAGSGTKLCSECEKLTAIHFGNAASRRTPYEKHFWIVMTALGLSIVLLIVALLLPARSKNHPASADAIPGVSAPARILPEKSTPTTLHANAATPRSDAVRPAAPAPAPISETRQAAKASAITATFARPATPASAVAAPAPVTERAKPIQPEAAPAVVKTVAPVAPPSQTSPPSSAPSAASAASAEPVAKVAGSAEASKAADSFSLDMPRARAFTRLLDGDLDGASQVFKALRPSAPPEFLPAIDDDLAALEAADRALKAYPDGLKRIDASRAFTLHLVDGKSIVLSAGCTVAAVKDDQIAVEQKFGEATATQRLGLRQLAPQTRFELAALGLPATPANDFSLAALAYVFAVSDTYQLPVSDLLARFENAKKDSALAERATRLQQRYTDTITERVRAAAMSKLTAAINSHSTTQAKALLRDFKRDFASGEVPAAIQQFIDKAAFDLSDLKPGLWASYYCGEEENPLHKYLFSREATKLDYSWGAGSPDPKIPNDCFGIRFRGVLRITTAGTYVFNAAADDFLDLSVDGKHVLSTLWTADGENGKSGSVRLDAGDHELKITYKEIFVNALMRVRWKTDGGTKFEEIPESALFYDPKLVEKYQKDLN